jgi:anti-sigma regulatory factor (Ser/Thr protein kinase)
LREISLHIIDIAENGVAADADLIKIKISELRNKNLLEVTVSDNGKGIAPEIVNKVTDPFFTTRSTRRVGLGLSLFKEAAKRCGGEFNITSREGKGTEISASFVLDHIDLAPTGDLAGSITCLIMGNPGVDFIFTYEYNQRSFTLDTRDLKRELDGVPINRPEVLRYIEDMIKESMHELKKD